MQLLIILALLLYGGKNNAEQLIQEVKPVLEYVGGDSMKEALKSAEEITSVLSAVKQFTGNGAMASAQSDTSYNAPVQTVSNFDSFPLAPVNEIADKSILNSLTTYIQTN